MRPLSPPTRSCSTFVAMRKAIVLLVTVSVEADDEPTHDFPRRATAAVRDAIKVGRSRHPDLTIMVDKIVEAAQAP
jgi:hypothetical protein